MGEFICTTFFSSITWRQSFSVLLRAACPKIIKLQVHLPSSVQAMFAKTAASSPEQQMLLIWKEDSLKDAFSQKTMASHTELQNMELPPSS